ncbi:MAG: hypothetical protein GF334_05570 [Candidatus Altiarchaeales archaeon]|nr:hypothetical protein [Candidatus Altiarchaeales archaeon]
MEQLNEKPVTLAHVAEVLTKKEKEYEKMGGELLYEQRKAFEHAKRFHKLNVGDAEKLQKKLLDLPIGLSEERAVKIIDLMPESVDDVRAIFAKERFKYSEEEIKTVIDQVDQFR